MTSSEQLEREAEAARGRILSSLTELRERLTPGQVVDEMFDFTRDGRAGRFVRNLGQQSIDNPIPVALIGAGIAWLAFGGRGNGRPRMRASARSAAVATSDAAQRAARAGEQVSDMTSDAMHRGKDAMQRGKEAASDALNRASMTTSAAIDRAGEQAAELAQRAAETGAAAGAVFSDAASSVADSAADLYGKTAESARAAVENARGAAGSVASLLKDEPLVLAGIGLALGALLGAAFPETEAENKMMGRQSDALKESAAKAAQEQWQKGEAVVEKAWEEGKHEAQSQGLMPAEKADGGSQQSEPSLVPPDVVPSEAEQNMATLAENERSGA